MNKKQDDWFTLILGILVCKKSTKFIQILDRYLHVGKAKMF